MEQIGQIMQRQGRGQKTQPAQLPVSSQRTMMIQKYGSKTEFITTFNPDCQQQICANADNCFFGDYPTLGMVKEAYGSNMATAWLVPQLYDLSEYCGCKEKLQGKPLEECAGVIATEFYFLKISEIMLFLYKFKSGKYGRFYGSVDPLVITTSLREFLKERLYVYDKREQEIRDREAEESRKNAITWEQYCEMHNIKDKTHPLNRKYDTPTPNKHKENREDILRMAKSILDDEVGDDNVKYQFTKIFKKKYGCTPQEYISKYDGT